MLLLGSTLRGELTDKVRALLSTRVLHGVCFLFYIQLYVKFFKEISKAKLYLNSTFHLYLLHYE